MVNSKDAMHFPLEGYDDDPKGFSVAYERFNKDGSMVMLSHGVDPYDKSLPKPRRSLLRHALDDHLVEIFFKGRIDIEFHSWMFRPHFKYWTIAKREK